MTLQFWNNKIACSTTLVHCKGGGAGPQEININTPALPSVCMGGGHYCYNAAFSTGS